MLNLGLILLGGKVAITVTHCLTLYFEYDCGLLGPDLALTLVNSDFFQSGGILTRAEHAHVRFNIFATEFFDL